jgi:hypothetical protein
VVTVATLHTSERINARDTCHGLSGTEIIVQTAGEIPDVTVWGAAILAASLLLAMGARLRRVRTRA